MYRLITRLPKGKPLSASAGCVTFSAAGPVTASVVAVVGCIVIGLAVSNDETVVG